MTPKLTVENVDQIAKFCLFAEEELASIPKVTDAPRMVLGEGVRLRMGFNKTRLEASREKIADMLRELPDEFIKSRNGSGWSFLNAVSRKGEEEPWGDHEKLDVLLCLGIAAGYVTFLLPRNAWSMLPGGVPYFLVNL